MLYKFRLRREGYSNSVHIGDSFEYEKEQYVVIRIGSVKWSTNYVKKVPVLVTKVVAQKYKGELIANKYKAYVSFSKTYRQENVDGYDAKEKILQVGYFIQDADGLVLEVANIDKIAFDFVDLTVYYSARTIPEWSHNEMEEALKKERLKKFTIIPGKQYPSEGPF
ncbi:hypothetical protein HB847_15690 [Listeria booriae]|uniref:Uncharacterized protein n=1 Tax=Listeria booriae TaxID=1552123 RepID=A0A841YA47_9LIST|nr:hypothetical protein [Listeria booriae]MBC1373794.1 hypothetical protein [Listeria booriae]